jgi:AhpD family alkylhydroperoxidase
MATLRLMSGRATGREQGVEEMQGPRISPAGQREMGFVNYAIAQLASKKAGANHRLNAFTTIGRSRKLFRPWIRFARVLSRHEGLSPADSEMVILRIAHHTGCDYEWDVHAHAAAIAGLGSAQIAGLRNEVDGSIYSDYQLTLIEAADELHESQRLSEKTWAKLIRRLSDERMIEFCMLVGNYEMVAMVLNSCRVESDFLPE